MYAIYQRLLLQLQLLLSTMSITRATLTFSQENLQDLIYAREIQRHHAGTIATQETPVNHPACSSAHCCGSHHGWLVQELQAGCLQHHLRCSYVAASLISAALLIRSVHALWACHVLLLLRASLWPLLPGAYPCKLLFVPGIK